MKTAIILILVAFTYTQAQFKDPIFPTETPKDGIYNKSVDPVANLLSFDNLTMHHSFNFSYSSFAGQGVALGIYTNSLMYKLADNMNVQVDASLVTSPYSTLGNEFQKSVQGVYLSRAAFNYKPWDDVYISIQYQSIPYLYSSPYSYSGSPLYRGGYFYNPYPYGF